MAAISITSPLGGATVSRRFTAIGTFSPYAATDPKPTVRLDNATGLVAQGGVKTNGVGGWEARFALAANHIGLTLVAEVTGASAIELDIDVTN